MLEKVNIDTTVESTRLAIHAPLYLDATFSAILLRSAPFRTFRKRERSRFDLRMRKYHLPGCNFKQQFQQFQQFLIEIMIDFTWNAIRSKINVYVIKSDLFVSGGSIIFIIVDTADELTWNESFEGCLCRTRRLAFLLHIENGFYRVGWIYANFVVCVYPGRIRRLP